MMKNKVIIVLALIIVIVGIGLGIFITIKSDDNKTNTKEPEVLAENTVNNKENNIEEDNGIYSKALEQLGILKEYKEIANNVNMTKEDDGVKITLKDMAYDKNFLIFNYSIETEKLLNDRYLYEFDENGDMIKEVEIDKNNVIKNEFYLDGTIRVKSGQNNIIAYCSDTSYLSEIEQNSRKWENLNKYAYMNIVSKNLREYCEIIDISELEIADDIDIAINIWAGDYPDEGGPSYIFEGDFKFDVKNIQIKNKQFVQYQNEFANLKFNVEERQTEYTELFGPDIIVQNENNEGQIIVNKVNSSKLGSLLYFKTNFDVGAASGEQQLRYAVDIIDKNGNIILKKEYIVDGKVYLTKKLNLNEDYTIRVYKFFAYYHESVSNIDSDFKCELVGSGIFRIF